MCWKVYKNIDILCKVIYNTNIQIYGYVTRKLTLNKEV